MSQSSSSSLGLLAMALLSGILSLPHSTSGAESVTVPDTIPTGLEKDVTAEWNRFLAGLPREVKIELPEKAIYRIEGSVTFENFESLHLSGNGATFRSMDSLPDADKKEDYSAWKKLRTRRHLFFQNSKNVVIENLIVIGAHPNGGREGEYDYNREAQHGLEFLAVENAEVRDVEVSDVWGDGIYISKHSTNIRILDSVIRTVGRQGIAVGSAWKILIQDCEILDSRRGLIDIEPYGETWATGDIRIIGNRFGGSRLLALPMGGSGSIGGVIVANNQFEGPNGTPLLMNRTKNEGIERGPLFFLGNEGKVGGSPAPGLRIGDVDGVIVAGNVLRYNEKREMTALHYGGEKAGIFRNHFVGAARLTDEASAPAVVEKQNDFSSGTSIATEVIEIEGGYAVRQDLGEGGALTGGALTGGSLIGVMRDHGSDVETISGFGLSVSSDWAWALVDGDEMIVSDSAEAAEIVYESN